MPYDPTLSSTGDSLFKPISTTPIDDEDEDPIDEAQPFKPIGTDPIELPKQRERFSSRSTGYFPTHPNHPAHKMEGGFIDRRDSPIYTLDQFRRGEVPYVTVAMDADALPYNTELQSESFPGVPFRVRDTGSAFKGTGVTRIDIARDDNAGANDPENNDVHTFEIMGRHQESKRKPTKDFKPISFEPMDETGSGRLRSAGSTMAQTIEGATGKTLEGLAGFAKQAIAAARGTPTGEELEKEIESLNTMIKRIYQNSDFEGRMDLATPLIERLAQLGGTRRWDQTLTPVGDAGKSIHADAQERFEPNPAYDGEFLASTVPQVMGGAVSSVAPFLIPGVGPAVGMGAAFGQTYQGTLERNLAAGVDEDDAVFRAAMSGVVSGGLESLSGGVSAAVVKKLLAEQGKNAAVKIALSTGTEGMTGAMQEGATQIISKEELDAAKIWKEGWMEALGGGGMSTTAAVGGKIAGQFQTQSDPSIQSIPSDLSDTGAEDVNSISIRGGPVGQDPFAPPAPFVPSEPGGPVADPTAEPEVIPLPPVDDAQRTNLVRNYSFPAGLAQHITPEDVALVTSEKPGSRGGITALQIAMSNAARSKAAAAPSTPSTDPDIDIPFSQQSGDPTRAESMDQLIASTREASDRRVFLSTGEVDSAEAARLKADTGLDLKGFRHNLDGFTVRHILNEHGDAASESARGLVSVTVDDIRLIPGISTNPDASAYAGKSPSGLDVIMHVKQIGDVYFYLEEVRTKKKVLASVSMRKRPPVASKSGFPASLSTSETLHSTAKEQLRIEIERVKAGGQIDFRSSIAPGPSTNSSYSLPQQQADAQAVVAGWANPPEVRIVEQLEDLPEGPVRSLAMAKQQTGGDIEAFHEWVPDGQGGKRSRVTIIASTIPTRARLAELIRHEGVGHGGLQILFKGKQKEWFNISDGVFKMLQKSTFDPAFAAKHEYSTLAELADRYGFDTSTDAGRARLVEEHLARVSESGKRPAWFKRVIGKIRDLMRRSGKEFKNWNDFDVVHLLEQARAAVQGNPSSGSADGVSFSLGSPSKFVSQLRSWAANKLDRYAVLNLGAPSAALRASGMSAKPLSLTQGILKKVRDRHGIDHATMESLPAALDRPIMIFETKPGTRTVLTELTTPEGNVVVAVDLDTKVQGAEVNDIRSFYGKDGADVLRWIESGKARWFDAEKSQAWLDSLAPSNSGRFIQMLGSTANQSSTEGGVNPPDAEFSQAGSTPQKRREHIETVKRMAAVAPTIKDNIESLFDPTTEAATVATANDFINQVGIEAAYDRFMGTQGGDHDTIALGHFVALRLQDNGQHQRATSVRVKMAESLTDHARAMWFVSTIAKTSPEGVQAYAQKLIADAKAGKEIDKETAELMTQVERLRAELEALHARKDKEGTGTKAVLEIADLLAGMKLTPERLAELQNRLREALIQSIDAPGIARDRIVGMLIAVGMERKAAIRLAEKAMGAFKREAAKARNKVLKDLLKVPKEKAKKLPRSVIEKLIILNNTGALSDASMHAKIAARFGIPVFTPAMAARIGALQKEFATAKNPEIKLALGMEMLDVVHSIVPATIGQKAKAVQTLCMLFFRPLVMIRNVGGNVLVTTANLASDALNGYIVDRLVSRFTGTRTAGTVAIATRFNVALSQPWNDYRNGIAHARDMGKEGKFMDGFRTMIALAKLTGRGVSELSDIKRAQASVFTSATMRLIETGLAAQQGIIDRAFWASALRGSLERQMDAARLNGITLLAPTPEMTALAHLDANKAIFQNDNLLSALLKKTEEGLNMLWFPSGKPGSKDRWKHGYGLGSMTIPFAKVPGAVARMGIEFSPLGFITDIAPALVRRMIGKPFNQREFSDSLSKALVGSAVVGTAYWLATLGILTSLPEEDKDLEAMRKASGFGQFRINVSALIRATLSGNWWTRQPPQQGDTIATYDWAQPIAIPMAMGGEMGAEAVKGTRTGGAMDKLHQTARVLVGGVRTIEELPMLGGIQRMMQGMARDGWIQGPIEYAANVPGNFVPGLFYDVNKAMDNSMRETRGGNHLDQVQARILARLPGFSKNYVPRYNILGEAQEKYQYGGNTLVNVYLNPSFISKFRSDPALSEIDRLFAATGDIGVVPKSIERKLTINGKPIELTNEQISQYQRYVGQTSMAGIRRWLAVPAFASFPDNYKAKLIGDTISQSNTAAKIALFGQRPGATAPSLPGTGQAGMVQQYILGRTLGLDQPLPARK